jgi:uncharacterized membrane protein
MIHRLQRTQVVGGDLRDVFAFFKSPRNLEAITPPWLGFHILDATEEEVREGTPGARGLRAALARADLRLPGERDHREVPGSRGVAMTARRFARMVVAGLVTCFVLDVAWLGFIADELYDRELGHLLRADVRWLPALAFYLIHVTGIAVFVAGPAAERRSLARAATLGAFYGVAVYSAFDLTGLAMIDRFPALVAFVDLAWGAVLSAVVSVAATLAERKAGARAAMHPPN